MPDPTQANETLARELADAAYDSLKAAGMSDEEIIAANQQTETASAETAETAEAGAEKLDDAVTGAEAGFDPALAQPVDDVPAGFTDVPTPATNPTPQPTPGGAPATSAAPEPEQPTPTPEPPAALALGEPVPAATLAAETTPDMAQVMNTMKAHTRTYADVQRIMMKHGYRGDVRQLFVGFVASVDHLCGKDVGDDVRRAFAAKLRM